MRWGICGAGRICNDFLNAMTAVAADNKPVAIGARSLERAQDVAKRYGIPRAYGTYEELVNDAEVDIVYISVIHPGHKNIASMCLKKGKPVLCEKPLTMTASDTKELVQLAHESKVFLMEGYWSRFFPIYKRIMEIVEKGELGEVQSVEASFEAEITKVARTKVRELGASGILDIGCYTLQFAQWVIKDRPTVIAATGEMYETGVDRCARIELKYPGGRRAVLRYDSSQQGDTGATVIGTKGKLRIPETLWSPMELILADGRTEKYPLPGGAPQKFNFINSQGFMYQIEHVRECLERGLIESPIIPLSETVLLSEIYEEILQMLGVAL